MADLANVGDVVANYRSLTQQETSLAATWLRAASAELRTLVTDLDSRILADTTGRMDDLARSSVAIAVVRRLMGADPRDPTPPSDSFWFRKDVLSSLRDDAGTSTEPQGAFPDLCEYPVY